MTAREALKIVCRAAFLAANGHEHSDQILRAIAIVTKGRKQKAKTPR